MYTSSLKLRHSSCHLMAGCVDSGKADVECVKMAFECELWWFNVVLLLLPIVLQC